MNHNINADLLAALSEAQAAAQTVDKDGRNAQAGYDYSTAEGIIRASRPLLGDHGLSVIISNSIFDESPSQGDIGNQWVSGKLRAFAFIGHKSGGWMERAFEVRVVVSRRRPHDKADMAALTFLHGFALRGILNLDRGKEDSDAVDRRPDDGDRPRTPGPNRERASNEGSFDYDQRQRSHEQPPPGPQETSKERWLRLQTHLVTIIKSSRMTFEQVCHKAGIEPGSGIQSLDTRTTERAIATATEIETESDR